MDNNQQEVLDDTHTYMNMELDVMFTQMQASRGFKLFGEIAVAEMVKELKQLYEGAIPVKMFVAEIKPYLLSIYDKKSICMR